MSTAPLHEIDRVCLDYFETFDRHTRSHSERTIIARDVELSLGMTGIHITYRHQDERHINLAEVNPESLGYQAKPSVEIRTWNVQAGNANYSFYRKPGLVIVNDFKFPKGEAKKLTKAQMNKLDASIETRGAYDGLMSRVLQPIGIKRIAEDIATVTNLRWYCLDLPDGIHPEEHQEIA